MNFSPEFAVRTELELEELVTKLSLVAHIVTKVEISVGHYYPSRGSETWKHLISNNFLTRI